MQDPVVSIAKVDRETEHDDLIITLRFVDPSRQVSEILGIPVVNARRDPCRVYNIGERDDTYKTDTLEEKYGVSRYVTMSIGLFLTSEMTNIKLYTWTPRCRCVVITMKSKRTLEDFIAIANDKKMHTHLRLKKVENGYEVVNIGNEMMDKVYDEEHFAIGKIFKNTEIQINARTGELELQSE